MSDNIFTYESVLPRRRHSTSRREPSLALWRDGDNVIHTFDTIPTSIGASVFCASAPGLYIGLTI